jgi:hypothetical protein
MRTTAAEVKNILDNTSLSDAVIDAYIASANTFVTETLGGQSLSDDLLENIEMWVTAHMIVTTRERVASKEGAGTAFINYAGQWGIGLNGSTYGQMAIALDTSLTLANIAKQKASASTRAVPNFD